MKRVRQNKILELIDEYDIDTQEELGKRLHESGFRVTQATISRDIKELQLKKQADKNGKSKYICVTPGSVSFGERYARVLQDGMVSIDQADNLVVIKTVSGMAMAVAAAIDALEIEEIVGSIAGDDTIMCAVRKRGKIFTVIGREIAVAVKEGGPDPNNNSKLRDVVAKAKANNMPNDTIERGIKKAAGNVDAVNYVSCQYEGYGPNGTAIIVEALTDNKNRTASNVRNAFTKGNGNVGTTGCVSYMFDQKGQILVDKEAYETDADEFMMMALDAGAEDFVEEEDSYEILTTPEDFSVVREALEKENVPMVQAEITMIPQNYVELTSDEDKKMFQRIMDLLDEDDDVQNVYHNVEEDDE